MSFASLARQAWSPALRRAITPSSRQVARHATPSFASARLSLAPISPFHSSVSRRNQRLPSEEELSAQVPVNGQRTPIGQIQQRLSVTFTCSVQDCGHRSTHEFAKRSYTHGIVIAQCPSCKNRHLIADNLSWFTEMAEEPKTIEEMIAAKGGKVSRGTVYSDGGEGETIEIDTDDVPPKA